LTLYFYSTLFYIPCLFSTLGKLFDNFERKMFEEESAEAFEDEEWEYHRDHGILRICCSWRDSQEQKKVGFDLYLRY
jgi:hypothetical protein